MVLSVLLTALSACVCLWAILPMQIFEMAKTVSQSTLTGQFNMFTCRLHLECV